jgi:uncharacterized cupredoxin-like copper-binding protein
LIECVPESRRDGAWTVGLPPGRYDFVCDVPFHIGAGMVGTLIVSG